MIYGYARISSRSQLDNNSIEQQEQEIKARYPDAEMHHEQFTGTTVNRPVFQEVIEKMQSGDILAVTKLDRFARNTVEGLETVKALFARGIAVHVFNIGLLEDTSMGQFFLTLMLAVAELERNNIVERTQNGKAVARNNPNYREGRKPIEYDVDLLNALLSDVHCGALSVIDAAEKLGVSRTKWYRIVKQKQDRPNPSKLESGLA